MNAALVSVGKKPCISLWISSDITSLIEVLDLDNAFYSFEIEGGECRSYTSMELSVYYH